MAETKPLRVFGLANNGAICFFNSAVQALVSCTILNKWLLRGHQAGTNSSMASALAELIKKYTISSADMAAVMKPVDDVTPILSKLFEYNGRQEDAHDAIMYILAGLGSTFEPLFSIKYQGEITCRACRASEKARSLVSELFIDIPEKLADTGTPLITAADIQSYIRKQYQQPRDYKCEKCGIIGQCLQTNTLAKLPPIIIMLFKKYDVKSVRSFPNSMRFGGDDNVSLYRIVAQIEHLGCRDGGHYHIKALRSKPAKLHDHLAQKIQSTGSSSPPRLQKLNTANDLNRASDEGVFVIDDDRVNYSFIGFTPTINTYVVIYERVSS